MPDTVLSKPEPLALDTLLRAQAKALRAADQPPADREAWAKRRTALRNALFAAMGPFPDKPAPLNARTTGTLERDGYRIEKVIFETRPDVWMTSSLYLPDKREGKLPAVLAVHGHWAGARRDPAVQARCLGLVKLGFVVLAVDAFGAGERYTRPARGSYHGALYGSALWPSGHTLLGMQVYDNQRAIDYLISRPEVDGGKLGITGASGGGNQTMYAGALDERITAVVPVCSVGTYQAYLHAACCVCEVLPGALRFAEEGDVLALVAPRALLVVSATKDAFQFSVGEAEKSIARARPVFKLLDAENRLKHAVFESPHDYNRPMREAMYGWMTLHLKGEGKGEPIPEPKHAVETWEDLACFAEGERPKSFLFPPSFAAREARALIARHPGRQVDHVEQWESTAFALRSRLNKQILGGLPKAPKLDPKLGPREKSGEVVVTPVLLHPEPELPLPVLFKIKETKERAPACVLLHLDGKAKALEHPLTQTLLDGGWAVAAPDLRGTGETLPTSAGIRDAPDHNIAEHALWVGRPLLGQWVFDVQCLLDWLASQPELDARRFSVVGIGQAGVIAVCSAALLEDRVRSTAMMDGPATYVTEEAYPAGTRMGLLVPGILRIGDIPHLAALAAPRRLVVAGGVGPQGTALGARELAEAFAFTRGIYRLHKVETAFTLAEKPTLGDVLGGL